MNTVYFSNDGLIDLTAVSTFGVNVKESDNPFGFFGTGLKYAIAILLRAGHEITIWRGKEQHLLTVKTKTVRGTDFNIVCLDGAEVGFTTELGKTWQMWQAFRELYCNTMDEGGTATDRKTKPKNGKTLITVSGIDFYNAFSDRNAIVLGSKPSFSLDGIDIHKGQSNHIYFRTIRVADIESPSVFTYNVTKQIELTEDRTVKTDNDVNRIIRKAVLQGNNERFIRGFISAPAGSFEAKMDMDWYEKPNDTFMRVMSEIDFKELSNNSLLVVYKKHSNTSKEPSAAVKTDIEIMQLEKAIQFCNALGYSVDKYKINVTEDLKESCLGMAYCGQIYLSRRVFMQGTKQVAATLLEEYMHIANGYQDETYAFQTYLFDVIVSLGERVVGEPI